jgi:hypothetical protein
MSYKMVYKKRLSRLFKNNRFWKNELFSQIHFAFRIIILSKAKQQDLIFLFFNFTKIFALTILGVEFGNFYSG